MELSRGRGLVNERKTGRGPVQPEEPAPTRLRLTPSGAADPDIAALAAIAEEAGKAVCNPFRHATLAAQ
eukprot:7697539-Pyramimonas_sp.AAC.1